MRHLIIPLIISIYLYGCDNNSPTNVEATNTPVTKITPGRFAIIGLSKNVVINDTVTFDLGELKGSKNYFFMLGNSGSTPIDSVIIVQPDSTIEVAPKNIERLDPTEKTSVSPIIKVTIDHGITLEGGIGYKPMQPMGVNSKTVSIRGISDTILTANIKLNYTAYLMAFTVAIGDTFPDLTKSSHEQGGYFLVNMDVPRGDSITISNTGNVALTVELAANPVNGSVSDSIVNLPLGAQTKIASHYGTNQFIRVSSNGTVADPSKYFRISSDGSIKMLFYE